MHQAPSTVTLPFVPLDPLFDKVVHVLGLLAGLLVCWSRALEGQVVHPETPSTYR